MTHSIPWRPLSEVLKADEKFKDVKVNDQIAITQYDEDFWWIGKVVSVEQEQGSRDDRFQKRTVITVACHEPLMRTRPFYADCVEQIAWKE